jgi:uncharacterized membrane protein
LAKLQAKHLFGALAVLYPVMVFLTLVVFKWPVRYLSIGIIVFGIAYCAVNSRYYGGKNTLGLFISPAILLIVGVVSLCLGENPIAIKLYPVMTDTAFLTIMLTSLVFPPPFVFHIINIFDKSITEKIPEETYMRYCKIVTSAWCVFFIIDASIVATIVFFAPDRFWYIYAGCITYVIIGSIVLCDLIVLKKLGKKYRLEGVADVNS